MVRSHRTAPVEQPAPQSAHTPQTEAPQPQLEQPTAEVDSPYPHLQAAEQAVEGPTRSPDWASDLAEEPLPPKRVSPVAMKRLEAAQQAIEHARSLLQGAGNQEQALRDSNFNSHFRLEAVRDPDAWDISESARELATQHPDSLHAAMATQAGGGNCAEHARVVYDYLRQQLPGEHIQVSARKGLDHEYVVIGDPATESDSELVVADSWPTHASATLWEDHFAYRPDRSLLEATSTPSKGDDTADHASEISQGLSLNEHGQQLISKELSPEETEAEVQSGRGDWIWNHEQSSAPDHAFDYQLESDTP